MTNVVAKQCESKDCFNPVLDGKYCEHCKQKRKETRNKIVVGAGSPAIVGLGGAIKKCTKIASKVIQVNLRKS